MINLQEVRNIKKRNIVLINGVNHLCTMVQGYANNPNKNFRFTNMNLSKKIRHSVYNEYYYKCEDLQKDIEEKKITFLVIGANQKNLQLALF